jgi:hypothetical protein
MSLIATYSQTFLLTLQQLPLRNQMSTNGTGIFPLQIAVGHLCCYNYTAKESRVRTFTRYAPVAQVDRAAVS